MVHPMMIKYAMEKALLAQLLEEKRQAQAQAELQAKKKANSKRRKRKATSSTDF